MTYACLDRQIKPTRTVQDGWVEVDVVVPAGRERLTMPLMRQIRNAWEGRPPCGHDFRDRDPGCDGCSLR